MNAQVVADNISIGRSARLVKDIVMLREQTLNCAHVVPTRGELLIEDPAKNIVVYSYSWVDKEGNTVNEHIRFTIGGNNKGKYREIYFYISGLYSLMVNGNYYKIVFPFSKSYDGMTSKIMQDARGYFFVIEELPIFINVEGKKMVANQKVVNLFSNRMDLFRQRFEEVFLDLALYRCSLYVDDNTERVCLDMMTTDYDGNFKSLRVFMNDASGTVDMSFDANITSRKDLYRILKDLLAFLDSTEIPVSKFNFEFDKINEVRAEIDPVDENAYIVYAYNNQEKMYVMYKLEKARNKCGFMLSDKWAL